MEPRERGRGEGKEEGRRERRIMAELLPTPWMAKEDFLCQCAGLGTTAAALQCRSQPPGSMRGTKLKPRHTGSCEQLVKTSIQGGKGKLNAAGEQQRERIVTTGDG